MLIGFSLWNIDFLLQSSLPMPRLRILTNAFSAGWWMSLPAGNLNRTRKIYEKCDL